MKKFLLFTSIFSIQYSIFNIVFAQQPCKELFISEYVDGNNKDKIIELYNPSDSIVALTNNYHLRIFQNGTPTPQIIPLQGNINPKETFVVTHPQADATLLAKANQTDVKLDFDGNDAIVLRKGISTDIDKIGEIGVNPGVGGWTVPPSGSTKDSDLRRKFPVDKGETDWNFGKNQWNTLPKDSLQDVKFHDNTCSHPTTPTCTELFISEYLDGSFKDKVIEIFNPTDSIINLINYSLKVFQNGAPTPLDIPLQGNINPKETHVVTHPQANSQLLAKADQTHVNLNFDGNDAVVLNKDVSTYIDKIGEVAINPGNNGWTIPPSSTTKDIDLRRKFPIDKGEGDWNNGKNQWDIFPKDSIQNIKEHQNICSATFPQVDIFYSFQNPFLNDSTDGNTYFEFDVHVKASNDSSFFESTNLFVKYDTMAFGSNIGLFGKLSAKRVQPFDDTTYSAFADGSTASNFQSNIFSLLIGVNSTLTSVNRVNLTNSSVPMFHIWMKTDSCNKNTDLQFINPYGGIVQSHFAITADTIAFSYPAILSYQTENFENTLDVTLPCDSSGIFWIADFNPKTITAGTNSILTITGTGFGSTRGDTGQVIFKNANNWGNSYISHLDFNDYASWSDNQIEIRLPSLVDTLSKDSLGNTIAQFTPGNGLFYVKNNSGDSIQSTDSIKISYARFTEPIGFPAFKRKSYLGTTDISDSATLVFYLDTSIANNALITAIVKKAMVDWRCATGVNFKIGGTVTNQNFVGDSINVIFLDDAVIQNGIVSQTLPGGIICGTSIILNRADIRIARDLSPLGATWNYDTTITSVPSNQLDFYEVILHELGHAHALIHILDITEVMYTGHSPGPIPLAGKITFDPGATYNSQDSRDGANEINSESTTITVCGGIDAVFMPLNYGCSDPSRIKQIQKNGYEFNLYPNPASESITISYSLIKNSEVKFRIYDISGRLIFELKENKIQGKNEQTINLKQIQSGIYFLNAEINSFKIIKF